MQKLKNSALFRWRLRRATEGNPLEKLLKTQNQDNDISTDGFSVIAAAIASIGLVIAGVAAYYVQSRSKEFKGQSTGVEVLHASASISDLNIHYVCIPPFQSSIYLTLPPSSSLKTGQFVSFSLPVPIDPSTPMGSLVYIYWEADKAYTYSLTSPGSGALFFIASESKAPSIPPEPTPPTPIKRWKLIREWPTSRST